MSELALHDRERLDEQESAALSSVLTLIVASLTALGVVLVYSSTSEGIARELADVTLFLRRQLLWVALATGVFVLARTADLEWLRRRAHWILLGAALLLVAVLVPGLGKKINGARRWIRIAGFNGQPSELAKLALIVYVSSWCASNRERLRSFVGILPILGVIGLMLGLVVVEPDMGTALLLGAVSTTLLLAAGVKLRHLFAVGAPGAGILFLFALTRLDYIWRRIGAFMDPDSDPAGAGFQTRQALIALGSGGLWGKGLGASGQKLLFLPEVHTDYIFALVGEELGLVGALAVVAAFLGIVLYGLRAIDRAKDEFSFLLATGIVTTLGIQALLNVAVATGSVPPKGIALPFLSFGGSSLLAAAAAAGLLARVAADGQRPQTTLFGGAEERDVEDDALVIARGAYA
ncbi:MAG: putative lipid II flippase FtsW [Planctomycetota bacterium]